MCSHKFANEVQLLCNLQPQKHDRAWDGHALTAVATHLHDKGLVNYLRTLI